MRPLPEAPAQMRPVESGGQPEQEPSPLTELLRQFPFKQTVYMEVRGLLFILIVRTKLLSPSLSKSAILSIIW